MQYLLSAQELTDEQREALERWLVPVARKAALGALTAEIGHDLANPLFAVLGHVDLLLLDTPPGSADHERLELIKSTALELKDSLRSLLDFAREPDTGESASLDAAARAATALVRHGSAKELQVTSTYPEETVLVRCSPGALTQAALHLVSAARDMVGDTGSIDVEVTSDGVLRVGPATPDGLGVVVASRIAADHGGSLVRDGDTFSLQLPLRLSAG